MNVSNKQITVTENGPYQVTGNIPLNRLRFVCDKEGASIRYEVMETYPSQETYFLCRCGGSFHKPFCDGAHLKGFEGKETAPYSTYDEMAKFIQGKFIDLLDAESLCAIARFCDTYTTTWNLVTDSNNSEVKSIVIQQCNDCPSGRLTAMTKEGKKIEPDLPQEISILEDSGLKAHAPIWVKGRIPTYSSTGKLYPVRNRATLCRCGKSQNKPFCDGKHIQNEGENSLEA